MECYFFRPGSRSRISVPSSGSRSKLPGDRWVANLATGQVKVAVEGEAEEIKNFVNELRHKMEGFVDQVDIESAPPQGDFKGFEIRH